MKRSIVFSFVMLFASLAAFGQNTLTIHLKDSRQLSFGFDKKPVVTFTDTDLVVKTDDVELNYGLALLHKFTFDTVETPVETDVDNPQESKSVFSLDAYTVMITGAKADMSVSLIAPDGKTLQTYKTDSEGILSFSIADLPEGLYIISSDSITCKILKK